MVIRPAASAPQEALRRAAGDLLAAPNEVSEAGRPITAEVPLIERLLFPPDHRVVGDFGLHGAVADLQIEPIVGIG